MPKYFDDEKPLPFARAAITSERFSVEWLRRELARNGGKLSLSLRFPGFPNDSLGYVFNIEQANKAFHISDITKKQLLTVEGIDALASMVLHVSGANYDGDWQAEFQKIRNQITSKTDPV